MPRFDYADSGGNPIVDPACLVDSTPILCFIEGLLRLGITFAILAAVMIVLDRTVEYIAEYRYREKK